MTTVEDLQDIAHRLRIHSIRSTSAANSGHPSSCCSAAEIMSVLFFNQMRYSVEPSRLLDPAADKFVLSKGHAAPVLYACYVENGFLTADQNLTLRKVDSFLEGHPTQRVPFVDITSGSLGQGLSICCGIAYNGKYFDKSDYNVYCLLGDGEVTGEGSNWEAAHFASHYKLNNLIAVVDINRLGQSQPAPLEHNIDVFAQRFESFGWNVFSVDGHDIEQLIAVFNNAKLSTDKPSVILAKTFKGKGVTGVEDLNNFHGKAFGSASDSAIAEISARIHRPYFKPFLPLPITSTVPSVDLSTVKLSSPPSYKLGEKVATRQAYGTALSKLDHDRVVVLDGDVKNSTFTNIFLKAHPDRFIECFIAEQNMAGVATGASLRNRNIVFFSSFAAFLSRCYDQVRMAALSDCSINLCGSHAGISIGADGSSQMALEDLAAFRALHNSVVLYPSDGVSMERAVELVAKRRRGVCYIRAGRPNVPVLYKPDEPFAIGKGKVVLETDNDLVTIVGGGVTVNEALAAAETLKADGVSVKVVDVFSVKPIDVELLVDCAKKSAGRVLVVEDHWPEGGIADAVRGALCDKPGFVVKSLAVCGLPRSATPEELFEIHGISAKHIVQSVKSFLQ